jgi:hypothetical protein
MTKDQKLQDKWEKRLEKHGLGVDQPMTDNSKGELAEFKKLRAGDDYSHLRMMMDGSDRFMEAFEIKSIRSLDRPIPEWALSNKEVQRVLMTSFPKLSLTPHTWHFLITPSSGLRSVKERARNLASAAFNCSGVNVVLNSGCTGCVVSSLMLSFRSRNLCPL